MIKFNITKQYFIHKNIDETLSVLNNIIATKFSNVDYSIYGEVVSKENNEFMFMAKWYFLIKPIFDKLISTKLLVKLITDGSKTKIVIATKSNPFFILFFFVAFFWGTTKLFFFKNYEPFELSVVLFLMAIGILIVDRIAKLLLISNFKQSIKIDEYFICTDA